MNNSKKLQTKKEKKVKNVEQKAAFKIPVPWIIVSIVLAVIIAGGLFFDQLYKPTLMKVDGKKYTISDLSFYFYNVEKSYQSYASIFGNSEDAWNLVIDESTGETMRDSAKKEAIQTALSTEILYRQAVDEGYSLTEEEKNSISTQIDSLLSSQITAAEASKNNFTKANLIKILSRTTLAGRYRQDKINALNIDKKAIEDGIVYEDYRQYDIQYIYISTKTTDADGNSVDMTAEQKQAAKDKITGILDKAKTTEDWSTLIPADETELTYNKDASFTKTNTTYSEDMTTTMMGMANGDVSGVLEDKDKGFYIVKMVNNNSDESFKAAVDDAVSTKENDEFNKIYTNDILPKHTYTIYDKALNKYKMGTITLTE